MAVGYFLWDLVHIPVGVSREVFIDTRIVALCVIVSAFSSARTNEENSKLVCVCVC